MVKKQSKALSLPDLIRQYHACWTDYADPDFPIRPHVVDGSSRVVLITGDNCAGKSYWVERLRVAHNVLQDGISVVVSIRERTGAGSYDGGMRRTMMFGDESTRSTGATSVGVTSRAFSNQQSRIDDGHRSLLVLDEPELGLASSYASAMGRYLAQSLKALPDGPGCGFALVSHNKALCRAFADELGETPTFVHLGKPMTLQQWLDDTSEKTVQELLDMPEVGHQVFRRVLELEQKAQNEMDAEKLVKRKKRA